MLVFNSKNGRDFVSKLRNKIIFADLKLHDIPNTCASAVKAIKDLNVDYLELRKTDNLSNVEDYKNISGQYILLGAIRLGETRLIDNIIL